MTTLITYWCNGGVSRCDAHCYAGRRDAKWCHCICGGANHGIGKDAALLRTRALAVTWFAQHPEVTCWTVAKIVTFRQPDWGTEDPRYFRSLNRNERYWTRHPNYQGPSRGKDDGTTP